MSKLEESQETSKNPGRKNNCKANGIETPLLKEFEVLFCEGCEKVFVRAERIDFTQTALNFYIGRKLVACFRIWVYFKEVLLPSDWGKVDGKKF